MSSDDRIRKKQGPFRTSMLILGISMTLFFIGFGLWLLLVPGAVPDLPAEYRNIFGVTVVVYGLYRGWRVYADYF
ncbi:MAG TPA: hypothetical protein PKL15_01495 [Saprospiraceae bacterium]|nr:hypothetical protein [Saprospiraceae bacterium]HNM24065.1 hypothetical protein [Saprospiraceae bacterium]